MSVRVTLPCGELSSAWFPQRSNMILYKILIMTAPNRRGFLEASGDFVQTSISGEAAPSKSTAMQKRRL